MVTIIIALISSENYGSARVGLLFSRRCSFNEMLETVIKLGTSIHVGGGRWLQMMYG